MTSESDGAAVRFPPPLIPLFTILGGAALDYVLPITAGFDLPTPGRYWIGGVIAAGALLVLGLWPVLMFRKSGQSVIPWKETPEILVEGPYRYTRNPMYLQMVLVCLGFVIILSSEWVLILTVICFWMLNVFAIRPEEAYLEKKFGDSYRDYKKNVRRWI